MSVKNILMYVDTYIYVDMYQWLKIFPFLILLQLCLALLFQSAVTIVITTTFALLHPVSNLLFLLLLFILLKFSSVYN